MYGAVSGLEREGAGKVKKSLITEMFFLWILLAIADLHYFDRNYNK